MKRVISVLLVVCLPMLCLCGCRTVKDTPTGEPAYIVDLQIIDGNVYRMSQTDGVYELFNADMERIMTFPKDTNVVFGEEEQGYFFVTGGMLSAFDPVSGKTAELCKSLAQTLLCVTEDYVLAVQPEPCLIDFDSGTAKSAEKMPGVGTKVLDVDQNFVFFWDDEQNAVCRYDCETDSVTVLYRRERNPSIVMVCGAVHNDLFYYAESLGGLYAQPVTGENDAREQVLAKPVIGLAGMGEALVIAVNDRGKIVFYACSEGKVTELAVWPDANYTVNGSCILRAEDNKLACAVTTQREIFEFTFGKSTF